MRPNSMALRHNLRNDKGIDTAHRFRVDYSAFSTVQRKWYFLRVSRTDLDLFKNVIYIFCGQFTEIVF